MVELERRRRRPPIWLAILAVGLLAVGGFYFAAPQVASISPAREAENVPRSAAVEITFNQPMDPESVNARLSVQPTVSGEVSWQGNTLRFAPDDGWPEGGDVTVRLEAGARSAYRLPMLTAERWTFSVAEPQVLYLTPPEGATQLVAHPLGRAFGQPLLAPELSISDYDVSADNSSLVYLARMPDGAESVHLLDLVSGESSAIHTCAPDIRCLQVVLSPDARWIALEVQRSRETDTGVRQTTAHRVLVLPTQGAGEPTPLGPENSASRFPSWAADNRLGYYDAASSSVVVVERASDGDWRDVASVPHPLGERWTWSPDGRFIVFPEVELLDEPTADGVEFYSHLYRVEVETGLRTNLSGTPGDLVEDAAPSYSPDGLWIAFARKLLRPSEWTPGRQLWIMRADGTQAQPLTEAPNYNHAGVEWNRSGTRLTYVRFLQVKLDSPPEVWWLDLESEERSMLIEGGYAPEWMP
ncbi:MAG: Ig-like domain-containing protein [Anaerolineales bacterium]|nr:Ig-like domain-containing protein [Anaerolineales bacterium]